MADEQTEDLDAVRAETRAWLGANWDPDRRRGEWIDMVIDRGDAVPTWPLDWHGRGLTADAGRVITAEYRAVGAPGAGQDVHNLWANTLLTFGTETLKRKLIRPLLRGEVKMCLLYSEPGRDRTSRASAPGPSVTATSTWSRARRSGRRAARRPSTGC